MDLNAQLATKREKMKELRIEGMASSELLKAGTDLTPDQEARSIEISTEISALEGTCKTIERQLKIGDYHPDNGGDLGLDKKEIRTFSIKNLIAHLANPNDAQCRNNATLEIEASAAVAEMRGNVSPQGAYLPMDIRNDELSNFHRAMNGSEKRDMSVGTSADGGHLVATNLLGIIEMLRNQSALANAGMTIIPGLTGDVAFPKQTGATTSYWLSTEGGAPTEGQQTLAQTTMTPKTLGAYTDYKRQLLLQSSIGIEEFIRSDITNVMQLAIDLAGLYGSGTSGQPTGLDNTTNVGAVAHSTNNAPIWAEIVEMRSAIAGDNALTGDMNFITDSTMIGTLMTTAKDAGSGQFLMNGDNDAMMGRRVIESNQVTDGDIWLGVWSQLIMGMWGNLDLLVDPYTASTSGTTRIVALQSVDFMVRHAESFCKAT